MDIPDDLIALERAAEEQRARLAGLDGEEYEAQRLAWREAAAAAQAAITDHATAKGVSRYELEMAVKRAVRHASEDPAE
ncbi:hypothetical protein [Streptomyces fumanus]|uniref:hypothetical protein n=1 Tax=Streptomyces fumanus TaxID=67302 RepID=UPI00340E9107